MTATAHRQPAQADRRRAITGAGPARIHLGPGQLRHAISNGQMAEVRCLTGTVWVTQERDMVDYVLNAGETFVASRHGLVVVQALRDAVIQINC